MPRPTPRRSGAATTADWLDEPRPLWLPGASYDSWKGRSDRDEYPDEGAPNPWRYLDCPRGHHLYTNYPAPLTEDTCTQCILDDAEEVRLVKVTTLKLARREVVNLGHYNSVTVEVAAEAQPDEGEDAHGCYLKLHGLLASWVMKEKVAALQDAAASSGEGGSREEGPPAGE